MKIITKLSPNYTKKTILRKIDTVIIHYTGMKSKTDALKRLTDKASKVSAHWLIDENGLIYKLVEEKNIAWHAGVSSWRGIKNINLNSIGIELVNEGHEYNYRSFKEKQMISLESLLIGIIKKYKIEPALVLGHSDIAPNRKKDPGELFDWKRLAKKKLAFWPEIRPSLTESKVNSLKEGDEKDEVYKIQKKLFKIGYEIKTNGLFDNKMRLVIKAFQRRFYPKNLNGQICKETFNRIVEVSDNLP